MSGGQDDRVGYRRPPKAHRFGAANSGNRRGRPAGSKNNKTLVHQIAHERQVVQENGRPVTLSNVELLFRTLQQKALSGDVRAIKTVGSLSRQPRSRRRRKTAGHLHFAGGGTRGT